MARTPRPWFREDRGGWYVTVRGKRHHLGDHPADAPPPRKQEGRWNAPPCVLAAFHALMAEPGAAAAPAPRTPLAGGLTVAVVFEKFLDWCETHRSPRTYEWSQRRASRLRSDEGTRREPGTSGRHRYFAQESRPVAAWNTTDPHDVLGIAPIMAKNCKQDLINPELPL